MSAELYRRFAADCVELATMLSESDARMRLYIMAFAWSDLAQQADKSWGHETTQVAQQQQQPQQPQRDKE
jgi:hypothetical protein